MPRAVVELAQPWVLLGIKRLGKGFLSVADCVATIIVSARGASLHQPLLYGGGGGLDFSRVESSSRTLAIFPCEVASP